MTTAVFHPGKGAALFGILPQMSGRFIGVKKRKDGFEELVRRYGKVCWIYLYTKA
jgi:hypothetical protein